MQAKAETSDSIIHRAIKKYAECPGGLMPLLHEIVGQMGCVPKSSVAEIATGMGLSKAEVHGVISFYPDFHYDQRGRVTVQVCRAESCQAMGSRQLENHIHNRLGIAYGETTGDGAITLEPVYCLGNCACSPSIRIGDETHARVDNARFDELIEDLRK